MERPPGGPTRRRFRGASSGIVPAEGLRTVPVIMRAASEARKATARAVSAAWGSAFSIVRLEVTCATCGAVDDASHVVVQPGLGMPPERLAHLQRIRARS